MRRLPLALLLPALLLLLVPLSQAAPPLPQQAPYLALVPIVGQAPPPVFPLQNGDFEQGPAAWNYARSFSVEPVMRQDFAPPVRARSGEWAAWLGGVLGDDTLLVQRITITAPTLVYYRWLGSQQIFCSTSRDYGYVAIDVEGNGALPHEYIDQFTLCDLRRTDGWQRRTHDLSAYLGQTVTLTFGAHNDDYFNSNFFVDDVSLE